MRSISSSTSTADHRPRWELLDGGKKISRKLKLNDFMAAMRIINAVAELAEREQHHPDLHLTAYRQLRIDLTTHAIGGISENDFILAAKIDMLLKELVENLKRIAVVGAGISGLAAAWQLSREPDVSVTILEASDRAGGVLETIYDAAMSSNAAPTTSQRSFPMRSSSVATQVLNHN